LPFESFNAKQLFGRAHPKLSLRKWLSLFFIICIPAVSRGQVGDQADSLKADSLKADSLRVRTFNERAPADRINQQYDFGDLMRNVFHPRRKADTLRRGSGITIVPNIAANPTIGAQLGIKAVGTRKLGSDPKTLLSIGATSASITTKNIIYFYVNHNIFTSGNKWNLQGNLVVAKTVTPDHGFGIGAKYSGESPTDSVLADPTHKGYAVNSIYYNVREKVYKNVAKEPFCGGRIIF
jgi:hypothetical protein